VSARLRRGLGRRARGARRPSRGPLALTSRGAVLLVALFLLGAAAILPLREYASQHQRIEQLQAKQRALAAANAQLQRERQRLADPAYVEQLAKQDFHLVNPGEQQWLLDGGRPAAKVAAAAPPARHVAAPWYRRAWRWLTGWAS
jgi:cell division protein FtsB